MSTAVFLMIMEAYRDTLGSLYPRQDPVDVVKVFEECAAGVTTQDKIRRATGLTATNLNKIVKRAFENGLITKEASRGSDGTKALHLTTKGRETLEEFQSRASAACSQRLRTTGQPSAKKGRGAAPSTPQDSTTLFDHPDEHQTGKSK